MKFLKALKIGYSILKKVEDAQERGLLPQVSIKGIPISAIDHAGTALVEQLKAAKGPRPAA